MFWFNFFNLTINVFSFLIILRAILSWFLPSHNQFLGLISELTDPIIAPIRKILPSAGGLDFSPFLALIILQLIKELVLRFF